MIIRQILLLRTKRWLDRDQILKTWRSEDARLAHSSLIKLGPIYEFLAILTYFLIWGLFEGRIFQTIVLVGSWNLNLIENKWSPLHIWNFTFLTWEGHPVRDREWVKKSIFWINFLIRDLFEGEIERAVVLFGSSDSTHNHNTRLTPYACNVRVHILLGRPLGDRK